MSVLQNKYIKWSFFLLFADILISAGLLLGFYSLLSFPLALSFLS